MFNKLLSVIFYNYFYKKFFFNKRYVFFKNDIDLSIFDSINYNGHSILYDEIDVFGKKYTLKEFLNTKTLPYQALEYLHSFYWLSNLKALGTKEASQKAYSLINTWSSKFGSYNVETWQDGILSERLFQILLCNSFIIKGCDSITKSKLNLILDSHVNHLFNLYKLNKAGLYKLQNSLKVAKALIAVAISKDVKKLSKNPLIIKLIYSVELDIKENIFHDGGHISRNPSLSLLYLEDLLQVYYLLKANNNYNLSYIRASIDRISLFIRSIRHPDGKLAIFNGGYESTKAKIDYILSLSNISTKPSMVLRNSGYTKMVSQNASMIFDVGERVKNSNSLLSFELSINKKKIITNLGNNVFDVNYALFNNEQSARTNNSCLVLKINNKIMSFDLLKAKLKVERRSEDNWEIIKFVYSGFKDIGLTYYRTIYVSRKDCTYILGEDMISINKSSENVIQEAYLNFHFSPEIRSIELYKKSKVVLFSVDDNKYIFSSNDNKVSLSKNIYSALEGELVSCYSISIEFNLKDQIIKNEWSISTEEDLKKLSTPTETIKILTVVDMQNSFLKEDGILSIKGADSLINKSDIFFNYINKNFFNAILFTQDTHFENEYKHSAESEQFPLHCEYKSKDWELSLNTESLSSKIPIYKMTKNKFDMWDNITDKNNSIGLDFKNYSAYKNLYKIQNFKEEVIWENLDDFLSSWKNKKIEIYIMGVASDFCVKYAIDGYIKRGFDVFVIQDLTLGIKKEIIDVLKEDYANHTSLLNIKLIKTTSI